MRFFKRVITAIGQNYYVYDPIDSETEWLTEIAQALEYDMPPVLDIKTVGLENYFPYSTYGHFVNVSGNDPITTDGDGYYFHITDPATGSNTWYLKSILYQANVNHFRSAYIW